jgi:CBS domain-containing protein
VVVSEQRIVLGLCAGDSLPEDAGLVAEDIMESGPRTLRPSNDVNAAAELLRKSGKQAILVTSTDGKLMGLFTP